MDCCVPKPKPSDCMERDATIIQLTMWIVDNGISNEDDYHFQGENESAKKKNIW